MPTPSFFHHDATTLSLFPDASFTHLFTSPPYNLGKSYGPLIDDARSDSDYRLFARQVMMACRRVATNDASIGLVIAQTHVADLPRIWSHSARKAGWTVHGLIRLKRPSTHQWVPSGKRAEDLYLSAHEVILCCTASPKRPAWAHRLESITWEIPASTFDWHPAAFHESVVERYLDLVAPAKTARLLDPFSGTGTTVVIAQQRGLDAVGTDLNPEYVARAKKRLALTTRPAIHHTVTPTTACIQPVYPKDLPELIPFPTVAGWLGYERTNGQFNRRSKSMPGLLRRGALRFFQRDVIIPYLIGMGIEPEQYVPSAAFDPQCYYTYQDLLAQLSLKDSGHQRRRLMRRCPGYAKIGLRSCWNKADADAWIARQRPRHTLLSRALAPVRPRISSRSAA